jgi:hypothetical protein
MLSFLICFLVAINVQGKESMYFAGEIQVLLLVLICLRQEETSISKQRNSHVGISSSLD